jgi:glycine cleavage system aminomethyltransferase T
MRALDMTQAKDFGFGTQIRKSPYFDATVRWGAKGFSVYNHMYIPRDFGDPEQNFWNLINDAILCDVAVERQVEITGPDAARFVQMLTPRDLSKMAVGQCKYVLITNADGGILNDPILLRLAENHFWLSLADSDILLWAQGVAVNSGMDVTICEPDVSPLQLQGPKSGHIMQALFGDTIMDLKYYWLREVELDGIALIVSRTGWSSELGYELYLRDGSRGDELWEKIMAAGAPFGLKPGHTSSIRRIEGAMLSYHADADINTNPFELGLDRLGQPRHGSRLHRQGRTAPHQGTGRQPQAGWPDHRGRAPARPEHVLLGDPQEWRDHRQGHFGGLLSASATEHRAGDGRCEPRRTGNRR